MKQTQIEKVVASLQAEKDMIDGLIREFDGAEDFRAEVGGKSYMLGQFIARLSTPNTVATPKPTRPRKGKGLPKPEPTMGQNQKPQS
jgi:hypothetical protein